MGVCAWICSSVNMVDTTGLLHYLFLFYTMAVFFGSEGSRVVVVVSLGIQGCR